jgi:hypothetical protein
MVSDTPTHPTWGVECVWGGVGRGVDRCKGWVVGERMRGEKRVGVGVWGWDGVGWDGVCEGAGERGEWGGEG